MLQSFSRLLAVAAFALCTSLAAQPGAAPEIAVKDLNPGDRIELRGNGGQSYLLTVVSVRDGVLQGRCLRSGSEFRGELSAISSVHRISVNPQQDMAPLIALIGSGLDNSDSRAAP